MAADTNPLIKVYKVVRWFFLAGAILALFLALKTPTNPGPQIDRSAQHDQAQAFEEKMSSLAAAHQVGSAAEVSLESGEVNAAIAESLSFPEAQEQIKKTATQLNSTPATKPASNSHSEHPGDGQIKDARVEFSNDIVT